MNHGGIWITSIVVRLVYMMMSVQKTIRLSQMLDCWTLILTPWFTDYWLKLPPLPRLLTFNLDVELFELPYFQICAFLFFFVSDVNVSPTAQTQLTDYLHFINGPEINAAEFSLATVCESKRYNLLGGLLSRVLYIPATSAPVERIFSQSGIIMRPHRARLSDSVLETLMFVKCNKDI